MTFPNWDLNPRFLSKFLPTIWILRDIKSIALTVFKKPRLYEHTAMGYGLKRRKSTFFCKFQPSNNFLTNMGINLQKRFKSCANIGWETNGCPSSKLRSTTNHVKLYKGINVYWRFFVNMKFREWIWIQMFPKVWVQSQTQKSKTKSKKKQLLWQC